MDFSEAFKTIFLLKKQYRNTLALIRKESDLILFLKKIGVKTSENNIKTFKAVIPTIFKLQDFLNQIDSEPNIKDVLLENGIHKYIVDYKGALLVAFSNNEEKVYNIDDEVYVLIPQGDFTAKKLITGIVINNYKTEGKDDSKTFFAS